MEAPQEVGEVTSYVGYHQMLVGAHEGDRVNEHAELSGTHGQGVEVELPDGGVRPKEVMTPKRPPRHHHRAAGHDETRLGHTQVGTHKVDQVRCL